MEISELTLKLIILLIPGGIGSIILERLTVHKPWTSFRFILNAIIIGVFAYVTLQLFVMFLFNVCSCMNINFASSLTVWQSLKEGSMVIPYEEVLYASIIAVVIGLILTLADTNKWLNNFANKYGISHKYGDENLFSYFLNSKEAGYVYIRHIKHNLTYLGYINSFSETAEIKEIVLSDVSVFTYTDSQLLYEIDKIYLSLSKDDVIIEFAKKSENG